jgi:hypothetical protein
MLSVVQGYFDEEPTGFFGSQTKDAVAKWQVSIAYEESLRSL